MPLEHEINKKEAELLLKQHEIINRVKYLENDKIVYIKYYLGDEMMSSKKITMESLSTRLDNLTTIVESLTLEMRAGFKSVNDRLDKVESRLDNLEKDMVIVKSDISILKHEATKHGWDLNPNNH